ncbi:MAG TPA: hypothetical protein VNL71_02330 [Chloroflexota bacterium]|nr:hypothetical protein [Chloroflexota bacterium]
MHQIPAQLAARAMGVPPRTLNYWLESGELTGEQTLTGRWWVLVGSCRALIRKRKGPNSREEANFDTILMKGELPTSPFPIAQEDEKQAMLCS